MTLQTVTLSALQPPAANPRRTVDETALEGLAASIRQDGLLQNLVVAKSRGKQFRIISGERRYRALQLLAQRGEIDETFAVPVEIRAKLSNDDKLRLATIENVQRENLPPLDEAAAFAALVRKGASLDDLAAKTGLSETTIRRRLALNELCSEAKVALGAASITLAQAEALTLGDHDGQRDVMEDIERGYGPYSAADIKDHLLDDRPSVAMAIFPVEDYSGTITTDLFAEGESSYFDDAEQFLELQKQAVEKLAREYEGKAAWVEVTTSYRIPDWQYEKAEDGQPSGVIINLAPSGRVEIREGLVKPEIDAGTRAATADNPAAPAKPKPAYSTPLCRYIAWQKSLAVQELLLADPRKAKEVDAAQRLATFRAHDGIYKLEKEGQGQSAYAAMEAQARLYAGWLGFGVEPDESVWSKFPPSQADDLDLYEAVQALSDDELDGLLTLLTALTFGQTNCERFDTRDSLFNRAARDLGVEMRRSWQPDRAFLERRARGQLVALAKECGYAEGVGTVGSFKKSELVSSLCRYFEQARKAAEPSAAQIKARDWLPDVMRFPAVDPDTPICEPDDEDM